MNDENRSPWVARADTITFREQVSPLRPTSAQEAIVEQCWNDARLHNPTLFDGKVISYAGHELHGSTLRIDYFLTSYKYSFAQMRNPALNLPIYPLAVSGMLLDPQQRTLLARRAPLVTQYPGFYELAPSGGISGDKAVNGTIAYQPQLAQELTEETRIPASAIAEMKTLGLIFEKDYGAYIIANTITLKNLLQTYHDTLPRKEYSDWQLLSCSALADFFRNNKTVPTSKTIAQAVLSNP